jgi:hypothetical protein
VIDADAGKAGQGLSDYQLAPRWLGLADGLVLGGLQEVAHAERHCDRVNEGEERHQQPDHLQLGYCHWRLPSIECATECMAALTTKQPTVDRNTSSGGVLVRIPKA